MFGYWLEVSATAAPDSLKLGRAILQENQANSNFLRPNSSNNKYIRFSEKHFGPFVSKEKKRRNGMTNDDDERRINGNFI